MLPEPLAQNRTKRLVKAKGEISIGKPQQDFGEENSCTERVTMLRRRTQEKLARTPAVAVHQLHQKATPVYLRSQAKSCKVGCRFFPGSGGVYAVQIIKLPQHGMATAKPPEHCYQPAGN
ncbi:MAG: hypothetical protein COZ69_15035 [Deltaproteobacteria bacterium CG_4_8_14_3_um_filter_45_9]|nr:MAG: hypothetical protein COZ69_15035 [Deltaproteobacteria bacterium CG_4_8_14_3_um_filter_45_9]